VPDCGCVHEQHVLILRLRLGRRQCQMGLHCLLSRRLGVSCSGLGSGSGIGWACGRRRHGRCVGSSGSGSGSGVGSSSDNSSSLDCGRLLLLLLLHLLQAAQLDVEIDGLVA
jgi:hypothetical protein